MPPNDSPNTPTAPQTQTPNQTAQQTLQPEITLPKNSHEVETPVSDLNTNPQILPLPQSQTPTQPQAIAAEDPPVPTPNQPPNPKPASSHKGLIVTALLILILIPVLTLGSGIALAYNNYAIFKPPQAIQNTLDAIIATTPLPKPPRIILASALTKSAQLKSADTKTEITISSDAKNAPVSEVKLTVSGPIDFQNHNNSTAEADIGLGVKFEGAQFTGSGSVKTVNNTLYFKVDEIPFGQYYQQLLDYKGKWFFYKIPDQYIQKQNSQPQMDKFKNVLTDFITKCQSWTTVKSQDGNTYTLEIKPPKSEMDNLFFNLVDAFQPRDQERLISDLEKQQVSKFTDKLADLALTARVNKSNYYLQSANFSFNINVNDIGLPANQVTLSPTGPLVYKFNLTTELSNYNKKIVVVPPEGAEDLQKIIDSYTKQSSFFKDAQQGGVLDAAIKNDIGAISTELVAYYTTPGVGSYPKDLDELVKIGSIKSIPKPPAESGIDSYTYLLDPSVCDGSAQNPCREVALFSPLSNPTTFGNGWCWQSITGKAQELPKDLCTATKQEAQAQDQNSLRSLLAPDQTVLGTKTNWEKQTLKLFQAFFK